MQTTFGQPVLRSQARASFAFNNTASHTTSCPHLWRHDPDSTFRWGHAGRRVQSRLSATADASAEAEDVMASVYEFDHEEEGEYCMPGQVTVLGDEGPYTVISMQVKDYPGLLRVVAWVLNGLELIVKRAKLSTDEDGFAHNKFWVTDRAGQQLRQSAADLTAERLGDYLVYCTPSKKAMQATNFQEGPITVDNTAHPSTTLVTVVVALEVEGALLKVTSALTNSGCSISEGEIEAVGDEGTIGKEDTHGLGQRKGERVFKFWVTDRQGKKLDYQRATSLVYTMGLVFGKTEGPLAAPNSSFVFNA